jgi:hypothetical protein
VTSRKSGDQGDKEMLNMMQNYIGIGEGIFVDFILSWVSVSTIADLFCVTGWTEVALFVEK